MWVNIEVVEYSVNALSVEQDLGLLYYYWGIFDVEMLEEELWLVVQGCDNEFTQAWYTSISQNKFQKQGMSCYLKVVN